MITPGQRAPKQEQQGSATPIGGLGPGYLGEPPRRRWVLWLTIAMATAFMLAFMLGGTIAPIRQRLKSIPAVGKLLFDGPVWPVLWNKTAVPKVTPSAIAVVSGATQSQLSQQSADLARREATQSDRENQVSLREAQASELQRHLEEQLKVTDALKIQLEGTLRSQKDRAEVVRQMKTAQAVQLLGVLSDDEVVGILKYLETNEVASILNAMEPLRAARILMRIPSPSSPG
jgi:flagellar motility protein MotE (MotC chaperone)